MNLYLDGQPLDLHRAQYFGGMQSDQDSCIEDLYQLPDETWLLHVQHTAGIRAPFACRLTQDEAVDWLLELKGSQTMDGGSFREKRESEGIPQYAVDHNDPARLTAGTWQISEPPPMGQILRPILPRDSKTMREMRERQDALLQPELVLERVLWPKPAEEALTGGFEGKRHDDLLVILQNRLEKRVLGNPQITIFQSLQDRGCDLLISWGLRSKFGIQVKSHYDITEKDFTLKTLAQIVDSQQHGLKRLYIILAGDLTSDSQREKVRGLVSRISSMNTAYVTVIPPERAWMLLFS